MNLDKIYEMSAAVQDAVNVNNALIAAGLALVIGVLIFIKRHTGAAK